MKIEMVDLKGQYAKIQNEIDNAIIESIRSANFINGPAVSEFSKNLSDYLGGAYVIPCANGTDALQIAMMALTLEPGDEVIVPSFTYVATAEVIGLLGLVPVMVDVDPSYFNITRENIEKAISSKTKAIVPVHLYGQCADMEYVHKYIGVNSRLDTIQAAVLNIKLKHLDEYSLARNKAADCYDNLLSNVNNLQTPNRSLKSTHVFHQYTLLINDNKRDALKEYLENKDIPAMIYYPIPLNEQEAYSSLGIIAENLNETQRLCKSVLSLPMHTELTLEQQVHITDAIKYFLNN